jgi:hypothetical protein
LIDLILEALRFVWYVPLVGLYLLYGVVNWRKSVYAPPLFFMNMLGFVMLAALFVLSMAGCPRYVYISSIMLHASHPLAWLTWRRGRPPAKQSA